MIVDKDVLFGVLRDRLPSKTGKEVKELIASGEWEDLPLFKSNRQIVDRAIDAAVQIKARRILAKSGPQAVLAPAPAVKTSPKKKATKKTAKKKTAKKKTSEDK